MTKINITSTILSTLAIMQGCARGLSETDINSNIQEILLSSGIDCEIRVSNAGVGEGDSENAYVMVKLAATKSDQAAIELEVRFWKKAGGEWHVSESGSQQLTTEGAKLCAADRALGSATP